MANDPAIHTPIHPQRSISATRSRMAAGFFTTAGLSLIAYPILRPGNPEEGLSGAAGFASPFWPTSHALGMLGFVLLALALRALAVDNPIARSGESRAWLAVAFLLPYYGAEAFALHAAGQAAMVAHDPSISAAAMAFRLAPLPAVTFAAGLVLLAMVSGWLVTLFWTPTRLGAGLAGFGLITYLPQFFTPMPVRIAHGIVLGVGLILIGRSSAKL